MLNTDAAVIRLIGRVGAPRPRRSRHREAQKTPINDITAPGRNQIHFSVITSMQHTAYIKDDAGIIIPATPKRPAMRFQALFRESIQLSHAGPFVAISTNASPGQNIGRKFLVSGPRATASKIKNRSAAIPKAGRQHVGGARESIRRQNSLRLIRSAAYPQRIPSAAPAITSLAKCRSSIRRVTPAIAARRNGAHRSFAETMKPAATVATAKASVASPEGNE